MKDAIELYQETFQSTHPTRGCDPERRRGAGVLLISIHAPHEGVRRHTYPLSTVTKSFQSTHPTRGCDLCYDIHVRIQRISIHAPHEGVRRKPHRSDTGSRLFQSTHPTRGCARRHAARYPAFRFQSTHPTRGCDGSVKATISSFVISIHAPHEGVRPHGLRDYHHGCNFNPRTPRGGATFEQIICPYLYEFQSTHPTRGCDRNML